MWTRSQASGIAYILGIAQILVNALTGLVPRPVPEPAGRRPRARGKACRPLAGAICLLALPSLAAAQGFAGLGGGGTGFALPDRSPLTFPRDHGAHPGFRIEWWYLTANLTDEAGRDWGAQWTLFRSALRADDPAAQVWMAHAALTGPEGHRFAERLGRGGAAGQAGVTLPFEAWIDEWELKGAPEREMTVTAGGADFHYELRLVATGPLVLQGEAGYSVKSAAGQASRYYSQPFLKVTGEIETPDGRHSVTGTAWLDREWSSQPLAADQGGWDWFALTFDDGARLMAFRLRGTKVFTSATWIEADGAATPLPDGAIVAEAVDWHEVQGHRLPLRWRLDLLAKDLSVEVRALYPEAYMDVLFPYWEGPVAVTGNRTGRGYLELTGYE